MTCPWCALVCTRRELHEHLQADHAEQVRTQERQGRQFYVITCPVCGTSYDQRVKKAQGRPDFVAEFEREIRMVATDMLVNHLLAEHEPMGG